MPHVGRCLLSAALSSLLALTGCTAGQGPGTASVPTPSVTAVGSWPATAAPSPSATSPVPTPSAVASADGLIAVVEGRDDGADEVIHLVDPAGGVAQTIPRAGVCQNEGPAWIPGSRQLLFDSGRAGQIHLFRFDPESATVTQLTSGDRFEGFPAVSPDATSIAFDYGTNAHSLGISMMSIDGSDIRALVPPPDGPAFDSAPAFSPDGRRIAFVRKLSQRAPNAREAAFIVNVDGTGLRQLTDWDLDVGRIRWSPDGSSLIFSDRTENQTQGGAQDVWLINADGTGLVNLTRNAPGHHTFDPDWSPDGSRLAALEWNPAMVGHITMLTMRPDGSDRHSVYESRKGWFLEWPAWGVPTST